MLMMVMDGNRHDAAVEDDGDETAGDDGQREHGVDAEGRATLIMMIMIC